MKRTNEVDTEIRTSSMAQSNVHLTTETANKSAVLPTIDASSILEHDLIIEPTTEELAKITLIQLYGTDSRQQIGQMNLRKVMQSYTLDLGIYIFRGTGTNQRDDIISRPIINVSEFFKELQEIFSHGPLDCNLKSLEIKSETHFGLISKFKLKCKMCKEVFFVNSDNAEYEMDLNTSAVAGTVAIGCGYTQLKEFSAALRLIPMTTNVFKKKMELVNKTWESEMINSMNEAAEEERPLAIEEGRISSDGTPVIDVIADGCYMKRSYRKNYSSLSGAAAFIKKN